jgi:hypothetical protein
MPSPLILLGSPSRCHRVDSIIVRSRDGGFVTQNCSECGKPRALRETELPDLICGACEADLEKGRSPSANYQYSCGECGLRWLLAFLVPAWDDLFEYHGYAIPETSDWPAAKNPLSVQEILALLRSRR